MIDIASPLSAKTQVSSVQTNLSELRTGLLHVRGKAADTVFHAESLKIGDVQPDKHGSLIRLRRDELILLTDDAASAIKDYSETSAAAQVTLTDITHGRCAMTLSGTGANQVLAKVCALDFADAKFPNHRAAQTSLAKVRALIVRADRQETPAYHIIVDRSLGTYVWEVVADAATHNE